MIPILAVVYGSSSFHFNHCRSWRAHKDYCLSCALSSTQFTTREWAESHNYIRSFSCCKYWSASLYWLSWPRATTLWKTQVLPGKPFKPPALLPLSSSTSGPHHWISTYKCLGLKHYCCTEWGQVQVQWLWNKKLRQPQTFYCVVAINQIPHQLILSKKLSQSHQLFAARNEGLPSKQVPRSS